MRRIIIGTVLAIAASGAAQAADYVVVRSTDPTIRTGVTLNGGQKINLASGQTLTLIAAAGDVTTLRGGPAGATAPVRRAPQADGARLEALRVLIDPPPTGRTFGGRRGGVCPDPATLKTLDDILAVQRGDCAGAARAALEAYAASTSN
jgi:opacity protein-like surface antigen